jgi:hypothetical protein
VLFQADTKLEKIELFKRELTEKVESSFVNWSIGYYYVNIFI